MYNVIKLFEEHFKMPFPEQMRRPDKGVGGFLVLNAN
jgi:hypothetical protein